MTLRKYRWSRDYESAEEELVSLLAAKNIQAERWVAEEYEELESHEHAYNKQFWCVEGSTVFTAQGKNITLQAGDVLDIPARIVFSAKAGFSGCVCYESPRSDTKPTILV
ncbi:hypothetical protein BH10PAT3_BH10PAT3_7860 [soil metagenome]